MWSFCQLQVSVLAYKIRGAKDEDDPMAFVKHDFEGSWKPDSEKVKPVNV